MPLALVSAGIGNGDGTGTEGAVAGHVLGTYLHGPVLARNPALADLLLCWALDAEELAPLDDAAEDALRQERLGAAGRSRRARPPVATWKRHVARCARTSEEVYRVSNMQPAMGPPPTVATATSAPATWRAPA